MDLIINNYNWAFRCPKSWENLKSTVNQNVKFCDECKKNVFLCKTDEDVEYHSERLNCVFLLPENEEEFQWEYMGKYLPAEYKGATMKIILQPIYSLEKDQVKFLVRAFELGKFELDWNKILCDGKEHTLKGSLPPKMAESLAKRLDDRNILYRLEVEPENVSKS